MDKEKQVQKLLEEGLYHYGHGEIGVAVELWKQVLELDSHNDIAREYLSIELGPAWSEKLKSRPKPASAEKAQIYVQEKPPKAHRAEFNLGQQQLRAGKCEDAFTIFRALLDNEPDNTSYKSYLELSKAALVREFLKKVGGFNKVPVLKVNLSKITEFKLSEEQGFILSLINGETSFEDIVYLSPVPPFVTFSSLKQFYQTGMIGLKEKG
jgi:tetratricopeptide (TPR) repeat protein